MSEIEKEKCPTCGDELKLIQPAMENSTRDDYFRCLNCGWWANESDYLRLLLAAMKQRATKAEGLLDGVVEALATVDFVMGCNGRNTAPGHVLRLVAERTPEAPQSSGCIARAEEEIHT